MIGLEMRETMGGRVWPVRLARMVIAILALGLPLGVAHADDTPEEPAPAVPETAEPDTAVPGTAVPEAAPSEAASSELAPPAAEGPVESVAAPTRNEIRPRPPAPPPPGSAMPDWDLDHLNPTVSAPPLPPPDPFAIRPLQYRHDIRTASADGRITPLKRIPQWVDVIERHEIEAWRPKDLGFLAGRLANVTMADAGNPFLQIPGIRGQGFDRVRVLTDGVWPSTQALGSQGSTLSLWDPESTERVEIYHGPGTYLRAIDAPGGFINIVPRRPRQHGAFGADFRTRQSYDSATGAWRNRIEADIGQGKIAALAGITTTFVGNRETGSGTLRPTSYDQVAADLALDYFVGPKSRIGLTVQYMDASDIDSPFQTGTVSQPSYERLFVGLSFTNFNTGSIFHGNRLSVSLDGFFSDSDTSVSNQNSGIGGDDDVQRYDFNLKGRIDTCSCHETYAELSGGYARLDRNETLLCVPTTPGAPGVPLIGAPDDVLRKIGISRSQYADLSDCQPVSREYEAEEYFLSGILEDQVHQDCFDLYAGGRFDYFHVEDSNGVDRNRFLFAGAAGGALHVDKRRTVYGNISYGRRRPSLFERGATEVVNGTILFGNSALDPEIHGNAEVGIKASYRDYFSFQVAGFAHYIDDTIAPLDLVGNVQQLTNQGDVWLFGGEATAAYRPFRTIEGLEGFGSVGITRSTETSLVDDVPFKYRAGARYSVPAPKGYRVRRWFGELSFRGTSSSRRGPLGDGAYVTGDFNMGAQLDLGRYREMTFGAGVTNLFDRKYKDATSQLRAPGRSFFVQFGLDF